MGDADEFLTWLCWSRATTGERFFPPDETAKECMEAHYSDKSEWPHETYGVEQGQHSRAWSEAVELFIDLQNWGFDPVERAEQYVEQAREEGDDLPEIDWSWLEVSRYEFGGSDD